MKQSDTIGNLAAALSRAQGAMKLAAKDAQNPHLRNKYADLTSVWEACRDALAANEISVSQLPSSRYDEGQLLLSLTTILMHSSGEWISDEMAAFVVGNKGVNDLQAMGSTITYMRRYALSAMVGVATGDDDDGATAQVTRQAPQRQEQPQQPPPPNGNGQRTPPRILFMKGDSVEVRGKNDVKPGTVVVDYGVNDPADNIVLVKVDGNEIRIGRDKLTPVPAQPTGPAEQEPLFDEPMAFTDAYAER